MKRSLVGLTILAASHAAMAQIQGVVRDDQGQVIAGASIDVVGAKIKVKTNERGEFRVPQLKQTDVELHVKAPHFMHRTFHVTQGTPIELVLTNTPMEIMTVVGLPWHASNMESAQPVNVLSGDKLRDRQAATLGETLKHEVGVHSSYYGPVASSPIIRGLEGPRVLISQNGLDAGDASRVGPDHAVATEASTARQIEILRGPATLFYGSGAIGGVVNIVDDRIPQATDSYGEWRIEHNSVANDQLLSASGNTGIGEVGLHADGFVRDADDYKIPGPAEVAHEEETEEEHAAHEDSGRLENSATEAKGFNLGGSFVQDDGFVGLSYGRLERQYGIPGHSHGDEALDVYADLVQNRVQLISELSLNHDIFSAVNSRLGFTDYEHKEIEAGAVGTTFKNNTQEARLELFHHPVADWRGAVSFHYKHADFSALGDEAFTPPSRTSTLAIALMEERHFGDLLIQLGARAEQVTLTTDNITAELNEHEHDEPINHELTHEESSTFAIDHASTPFSASAGAVWDFTPGYNLALSYTHAQRAPSAAELLSFGPHLGSGLYEIGAYFQLEEHAPDEFHVDLAEEKVRLETSNNLDISLRKFEGQVGFILNAFYNTIDNYYYLTETNVTLEHDEDEGEEHEEHGENLPVYIYEARNAELYGFETEWVWQVRDPLKFSITSDYIRARLIQGDNLPRIPPLRLGVRTEYTFGNWLGELSSQRYFEQDKTASMESTTDAYTLLDMQLSYAFSDQLKIFVKGNNLTDEYARVHASFLKDKAPLPARAFAVGLSGRF